MALENPFLREYAPVNLDQHKVDDLVISCSDHRFRHAFFAVPRNRGITRADELTVPAPSIKIISGQLIPDIIFLQNRHEISNVHVMDHTYCGGFDDEYENDSAEERMLVVHERKLEAARGIIHEVLPGITVVTYVVGAEEVKVTSGAEVTSYTLDSVQDTFRR